METLQAVTINGGKTALDEADIRPFEDQLRGPLLRPGDDAYEAACVVYNAMIARRPALIVRCRNVGDVVAGVTFARENDLILAIRGGGHNVAGLGTCDDGLVLDLSPMKGIRVDPEARTVRVEGGCTWGEIDHATHAFGLATPGGLISTTGVGGLTLGGGLGHLTRKYGLTIDNLLAVDMVLADGRFVTASAQENEDLFWAVRGGGGNFGVVTSFLLRLHPVDTVVGGPTLWSIEQAAEVMRWYRTFITDAPEDLNGFFAFLTVPPAPPFPAELHLETMCGVVWCYTGPVERAGKAFNPVKTFGPPAFYGIHPMPFPALQSAFDDLYRPGLQHYWRANFFNELSDEAIAEHVEYGAQLPTMLSGIHLHPIDGAAHRVGKHDTAFSYRDATFAQNIIGIDADPANAVLIRDWTVEAWEAMHAYSAGGAYVNFMVEANQERIKATYRDNYERLTRLKAKYDSENVFRVNQNITPAVSMRANYPSTDVR